jgi:hypothetical protein
MGIVLAIVFLAIAVVALVVYGGTPHGGPTTTCGPITAFGHTFTVSADCRYISIGELVVAGAFFFLAILAALSARPRGPVR